MTEPVCAATLTVVDPLHLEVLKTRLGYMSKVHSGRYFVLAEVTNVNHTISNFRGLAKFASALCCDLNCTSDG
jgi:hypothetical protein